MQGTEFIRVFEQFCPLYLAEEGDPVGLHIGTLAKPIQRVMMTLDVRPEVVQEAIEKKIDLIVAKHPPIFRPIERFVTQDPQIKMYEDLIKNDIAVYAAHTNMDIIENGLNDWFCEMLEINETTFLTKTHTVIYKKLAVFVPEEAADKLRRALGQAGAGSIGENYKNCSYSLKGEGRFTPIKNAQPAIGEIGKEERVKEEKIEVIFPETSQKAVLAALYTAHPYEEPAYDIFTIENYVKEYGLGRVGNLAKPLKLSAFTAKVKEVFQLDGLRLITADPEQEIQRVAICGGSGGKFYQDALAKGADVYLTGDVYYHTAHDMLTDGLSVIDPGHYIEQVCVARFVELFEQWKAQNNWSVSFFASEVNTNPFRFC